MTTLEEQRIAAAIGWCLGTHQILKTLSVEDQIWNYSGTISNSELRLYEENGPSVIIDLSEIKQVFPTTSENRNLEFGERKWANGSLNGKFINAIVSFHDDMKVSRVLNHFVECGRDETGVKGGVLYKTEGSS